MGKKKVKSKTKTLYEIYEKMFLDFLLSFLLFFAGVLIIHIITKINWIIFIPFGILFGGIIAFGNNVDSIKKYKADNKYAICPKCGYKNRKTANFCSKCGEVLEAYLESTVEIYRGDESWAVFVYEVLQDAGIISWKNSIRYKIGLPVAVYVFGKDLEEARKIVEKVAGGKW